MDTLEATAIIVKTAIEQNMIIVKSVPPSCFDEERTKANDFNAERVADFIKIVYDALGT